jgi:putative transposase
MLEAFVNTIKRDYLYTNDCNTAENVMKMLNEWFADYNQIAPHSALGIKSSVEYRLAINKGEPFLGSKAKIVKLMCLNNLH